MATATKRRASKPDTVVCFLVGGFFHRRYVKLPLYKLIKYRQILIEGYNDVSTVYAPVAGRVLDLVKQGITMDTDGWEYRPVLMPADIRS